jgi:hypothetical protein
MKDTTKKYYDTYKATRVELAFRKLVLLVLQKLLGGSRSLFLFLFLFYFIFCRFSRTIWRVNIMSKKNIIDSPYINWENVLERKWLEKDFMQIDFGGMWFLQYLC